MVAVEDVATGILCGAKWATLLVGHGHFSGCQPGVGYSILCTSMSIYLGVNAVFCLQLVTVGVRGYFAMVPFGFGIAGCLSSSSAILLMIPALLRSNAARMERDHKKSTNVFSTDANSLSPLVRPVIPPSMLSPEEDDLLGASTSLAPINPPRLQYAHRTERQGSSAPRRHNDPESMSSSMRGKSSQKQAAVVVKRGYPRDTGDDRTNHGVYDDDHTLAKAARDKKTKRLCSGDASDCFGNIL